MKLECGPMPNVMAALPNMDGALCSTPQSLADSTRVPCSNDAKTRKPLKFDGVPQTNETISAASGPKFSILCEQMAEILLLNKFFSRLSINALVAKIQPGKVVRWCADGDFLRYFCVLYFQRAACSTFQICILILHYKTTPCVQVW